jgi:hypothetical protein
MDKQMENIKVGDLVVYGNKPGLLYNIGPKCFEDTDQLCQVLFTDASKPVSMVVSALKKMNS